MNLGSRTGNGASGPAGGAARGSPSSAAWKPELRRLIEQALADGDVLQFLRCLSRLMVGWCSNDRQRDGSSVGVQPATDQLPEHLRQSAGVPEDQDQRLFILPLVDEAMGLLNCEERPLVRRFMHQSLNYLANCERRDQRGLASSMRVIAGDASYTKYEFPLELAVLDSDGKKTTANMNSIFIDQQERILAEETEQFELNNSKCVIVNMRLSNVKEIKFTHCYRILTVNISHTFIRHVDIRELIDLEDLRLMNTNIRRLNLVNQRKLKTLVCNYTLVDCLLLPGRLPLKQLYVEYSGRLKMNAIAVGCEVISDKKQTVEGPECKGRTEMKLRSYTISYPEMREDKERILIHSPEECNELVDKDIKECKKLTIYGFNEYLKSAIGSLDIVGYPNLEELTIEYIECKRFCIADLPSLINIKIEKLQVNSISLVGFPSLEEIQICKCDSAEELDIEDCEKVKILEVYHTNVEGLDVRGLKELKELEVWFTSFTQIDLSHNGKIEKLYVIESKIINLDVSQLIELKELCVSETSITEINVSRNIKLEELYVCETKISQLDVSELMKLTKLCIQGTNLRQIDLSSNKNLTRVGASRSCRVLSCCCYVEIKD